MMQEEIYERARKSRDARFDGQFYIGVRTTGIYCRPICPANTPKSENVMFFPTAAAASEAGYRPCLRCRPECAPGTPAWSGTSATVRRGLKLIASGALDDSNIEELATRLGVTSRHLRRLFTKHLGASPLAVAHTQRLHFAKQLIDQTRLPMQEIAMAAGYGSIRRFNDSFVKTYGRSPRELRRAADRSDDVDRGTALTVKLPCRMPFDWRALLAFFSARATPGIESVDGDRYLR
ncbi:MAG: helix-turn-helix domain-containing protein, partial [Gammaproteobacteria bacterium]|nr:helix-turn-helix domain-containing protein [Gammaproteobacteria bacterium]